MEPHERDSLPPGTLTSTTLLEGLRDQQNRTLWRSYVDRYRPLLVRYARRLGAAEDEAEDLAQSTLLAFSSAYRAGRYERGRGRLSAWLFGIARNELRGWARARAARPQEGGSTENDARLAALPADDALEELWEREWRDALLRECLRLVRGEIEPATMRAFRAFALEGLPAEEVARSLGTSAGAVFAAKHRVLQRLRELLPLLEDTW